MFSVLGNRVPHDCENLSVTLKSHEQNKFCTRYEARYTCNKIQQGFVEAFYPDAMLISTVVFVPLGTLLPLMVRNYFFGSAWHNGLIQTLFSSGMLIAAIVIGLTGGLKKQFLMISLSTGLLGLSSLIAGLIPANLFWVFCILVFLMGSTGSGFNIPFTAYIQRTVPPENLGKVLSLITSVMSFAAPVGMFIAGPIAEIIGVSNWMIIAGILMIFVGIMSYVLTKEFDTNRSHEIIKNEI